MTRIINIAGNSGSGKSVLALNLGVALNNLGHDVILIDANVYSPDLSNYSEIKSAFYLNDFLNSEKSIEETISHHPSGLKMILSMEEDEYNLEKHKRINNAIVNLIGKTDIILVDSFSHNPSMFSVIGSTDEVIFVSNDDYVSLAKSKDTIKKMEEVGMNVVGLILNRKSKKSQTSHIESIIEKKVLASIPYDEKVIESINMKQPFYLMHPKIMASRNISDLAMLLKNG